MKVNVLFERAKDGYYSCFMEEELPDFGLAGYGDTAEAAKADFLKSYEEIKEMLAEEGKEVPVLEFSYKYDLQSFFNYFDWINVSQFAKKVGINESKMRQYKNGLAFAGESTTKKILDTIKNIGAELQSATL